MLETEVSSVELEVYLAVLALVERYYMFEVAKNLDRLARTGFFWIAN